MTTAAIYARVSSARQREEQTIGSQTTALIEAAKRSELEVPADWVFEDEGYSRLRESLGHRRPAPDGIHHLKA